MITFLGFKEMCHTTIANLSYQHPDRSQFSRDKVSTSVEPGFGGAAPGTSPHARRLCGDHSILKKLPRIALTVKIIWIHLGWVCDFSP